MEPAPRQNQTDRVMDWVTERIRGQLYRPGARLPSIRGLAKELGVSPFTVAAAYDRLNAGGVIRTRPGAGVFVREPPIKARRRPTPEPARVDVDWLMHHMLSSGSIQGPGSGVLPQQWLDGPGIASALRGLGREGGHRWVGAGRAEGFEPLRHLVQHRLASRNIVTAADQIVLTTGVTQALDLTLRDLIEPGDAVLVFEPVWFGALAMLAMHRARIVTVPYTCDGPDTDLLATVVARERPRLMIVSATAHNPTGVTLSRPTIDRIISIANAHDVTVFEDDVYCDLGEAGASRFAADERPDRVVHAGSFSKTLGGAIRVGFLATGPNRAKALTRFKTLAGFTTPEINERLIHKLLSEGRYGKHVAALRDRLAVARSGMVSALTDAGFELFNAASSGLFVWVDLDCDTTALATEARAIGQLVAPGALFSPNGGGSTFMRVNVTTPLDGRFRAILDLAKVPARPAVRGAS